MKKYGLGKQGVYDRRFALSKKIKAAGLTVEDVLNKAGSAEAASTKSQLEKVRAKKSEAKKIETPVEETPSPTELTTGNKQVPVIMKPIQLTFDNFSIKLHGVPKKISVNPDTYAIEIDL